MLRHKKAEVRCAGRPGTDGRGGRGERVFGGLLPGLLSPMSMSMAPPGLLVLIALALASCSCSWLTGTGTLALALGPLGDC
mmetsp:Transcript_31894/g.92650  ORF Transcript_31894/g.92650 Transcript_31894/m.92650 type:complete len:81 (+) Transcript_31894:31-273(+)